MKWFKNLFSPKPSLSAGNVTIEWFNVEFDESAINLRVEPPSRASWTAVIDWDRIVRVCFKTNSLTFTDELYVFTDERPESFVIPMDAGGAPALFEEMIRRGAFDAELAIEAASSTDGLFCWPRE